MKVRYVNMIKILNQEKNILIDVTYESVLVGGRELNCIMVTKSGSVAGYLTAGIYNNQEEAQKIFNWINDKIKNIMFEENIYIEMPEKQKIEEGEENEREQRKSREDDKI